MTKLNPVTLVGGTVFAILGGGVLGHLLDRLRSNKPKGQPLDVNMDSNEQVGAIQSQGYFVDGTEYIDDKLVYKEGSSQPYLVRKRDGFLVPQPRTQRQLLNEYTAYDWFDRTERNDNIVVPSNWYLYQKENNWQLLKPYQTQIAKKAISLGFVTDVLLPMTVNRQKELHVFLYKNTGNRFQGIEFYDDETVYFTGIMDMPSNPKERRIGTRTDMTFETENRNQGDILNLIHS